MLAVVIRILFPKLRKRNGRLAGRGAPGSARSAILNALAALEPLELAPLLELFLEPLAAVFDRRAEAAAAAALAARTGAALPDADPVRLGHTFLDRATRVTPQQLASPHHPRAALILATSPVSQTPDSLPIMPTPNPQALLGLQPHWWARYLAAGDAAFWLALISPSALAAAPLRRRQGLLNTLGDLLAHLGFRIAPFLPLLASLATLLLQGACAALTLPAGAASLGFAALSLPCCAAHVQRLSAASHASLPLCTRAAPLHGLSRHKRCAQAALSISCKARQNLGAGGAVPAPLDRAATAPAPA